MRPSLPLLLVATLFACRADGKDEATSAGIVSDTPTEDGDGDGYIGDEDCDDRDPTVGPDAEEICDGVDNNCDGVIDENVTETYFADVDADGFGDPLAPITACAPPDGYVPDDTDCDDRSADAYPGAAERCDGLDNDCDAEVDEDVTEVWYPDGDSDGYGATDSPYTGCDAPSGYLADGTDCDDSDGGTYPGAAEVCDEADNNCDGTVDEGVLETYYQDQDADGYGVVDVTTEACAPPTGWARASGDCDDLEPAVRPSASELCDDVDNDCDGTTDEDDALDAPIWYADTDADGHGDAGSSTRACGAPSGFVDDDTDCDDTDGDVSPSAAELCNGQDDDCDGDTDEDDATDATTWYGDADGDGYGGSTFVAVACTAPSSFVATSTDCDDLDATAYPGAAEVCDGADNDCNGTADDGVGTVFYADADADGYGDASSTTTACSVPSGYTTDATDCDDADPTVSPGSLEVCDGADNDCDGVPDNDGDVLGDGVACAADSCLDILGSRPGATDGAYYVDLDGAGDIVEVTCEMDVDGGGWLAVFNWMDPGTSTTTDAATLHAALITNTDMADPITTAETGTAIETSNIDLSLYTEVMYGWAASDTDDVSRWGVYTTSTLVGECYVDGYCGAGVAIATMDVEPTGSSRLFYTGNQPTYPHVGIGWSGQIITWGYDLNSSSYGNWANWYDTKSCCTSGNTSEMLTGGWRYTIYIR
jgi:hypothetical protein